MVALNTAYAPSETRTQPKNRVGNFFGEVAVRAGENRPATRNRIGEKRPTLTIIASGRPVWPSRDPIGEEGGLNLYAMVGNDPLNAWDYLGLTVFVYDPVLVSGRDKTPDPQYGWHRGAVSFPMWASVSIYATDEGITAHSFAGVGGLWSYATVSASVECDEFGNISFSQSESYMPTGSGINHVNGGLLGGLLGQGSAAAITLAAFEEKTFGLSIPDNTINIEAFSGALAGATSKPVSIPNPGPVIVSFIEQVSGAIFDGGGSEENVSTSGLYIFECKCEEIP